MIELPHDCVQRIRSGDPAAFEALFRTMHVPLLAFATRYLDDSARAEELIQDLFFALWQGREEWVVTGSVPAYLYAAVRNRALNLRRRDLVEQRWVEEEARADAQALQVLPADDGTPLDDADLRTRLTAAMERLPARCALVMQMRWHSGMRHADIAATLGISVKGVEIQLTRGLKALRALLVPD